MINKTLNMDVSEYGLMDIRYTIQALNRNNGINAYLSGYTLIVKVNPYGITWFE